MFVYILKRLYQLVVSHLLSILIHFQNYNEMAVLFFVMVTIISVQKLRQVKSNAAGLLTIQRKQENIKLKRMLAKDN